MSDYTHSSLDEVEDLAPGFGLGDKLEARFARSALDCERSGLSLFRLTPDFRVPFGHRHGEQEEIYVLVSGSARMRLDDDVVELKPFDALRVAPQVVRCFESGPDGAEILAFGAGPAGDGDMIQGWWTG